MTIQIIFSDGFSGTSTGSIYSRVADAAHGGSSYGYWYAANSGYLLGDGTLGSFYAGGGWTPSLVYNVDYVGEQKSEVKICGSGYGGVVVRMSFTASPGDTGYMAVAGYGAVRLYRIDGWNSFTLLGTGSTTIATNDVISLYATGSTISVKLNGTEEISVTDSTYATGIGGVMQYGPSYCALDDFKFYADASYEPVNPDPPAPYSMVASETNTGTAAPTNIDGTAMDAGLGGSANLWKSKSQADWARNNFPPKAIYVAGYSGGNIGIALDASADEVGKQVSVVTQHERNSGGYEASGPAVRLKSLSSTWWDVRGYFATAGSGAWKVYKMNGLQDYTQIGSSGRPPYRGNLYGNAASEHVALYADGSNIVLKVFGRTDISTTDSTYTTGVGGVLGYGPTSAYIAKWFWSAVPPSFSSKDGLVRASIKSINGLAIASIKSVDGLA